MADAVAERFHDTDLAYLKTLDDRVVDQVMIDIYNPNLSLREVADNNGLNMGDVVQIARFHRVDPVTTEDLK